MAVGAGNNNALLLDLLARVHVGVRHSREGGGLEGCYLEIDNH